jgi:predicted transcriptional regulator of viral defense system
MNKIAGIGKLDRIRLAEIIRGTKGIISVTEAAKILKMTQSEVAKILSRWVKKGWLSRIRRGIYFPISLEARTTDIPFDDPWIIAEKLFSPCYIGGWSAAEYWDMTEQIFQTIVVCTTKKLRNRNLLIQKTNFLLRTISKNSMFGLESVWRGQVKVSISDPTRTVLDMINDPVLGGGIRTTTDIFTDYLKSKKKNLDLLIKYADSLNNGAIFKRLGFLLEKFAPNEKSIILKSKSRLTKGNAKLDPKLKADKLITKWRLWVPESWIKEQ